MMRLGEGRRQCGDVDEEAVGDDPLLATLMAASIQSRIATGPKACQRWRRLGDRVEPIDDDIADEPPPRCVREGGMSLHADVAVPAQDRKRLERLCRYVAPPPIAIDRLEALPDGRLAYGLKTRWRDGTTHVLMVRQDLLERLAPPIFLPHEHTCTSTSSSALLNASAFDRQEGMQLLQPESDALVNRLVELHGEDGIFRERTIGRRSWRSRPRSPSSSSAC